MSDEEQYVFHGRIVPERTDVHVSPPVNLETDFGEVEISISSSQIIAVLHSDHDIDNIYTVRNTIMRATYVLTDVFSLTHGYSYNVEITSVVDPGNDREVFGVGVPVLNQKLSDEDRYAMYRSVLQLYGTEAADHLQRSIHDLQLSINDPRDTGFFCYRSIETIRKYFQEQHDISNKSDGWKKMRNELGIEREEIDEVKEFADDPRHGGKLNISAEDRANIFEITWDIIHTYIEYLK